MESAAVIQNNIERIWSQITLAAEKVGRNPADISLMAVSKTVEMERIEYAVRAGIRCFGENRVQELREKAILRPEFKWEMIGPLQRNKIRPAIQYASRIQSIDSLPLAIAINRIATEIGKIVPVMIEVNAANEETKHGVALETCLSFAREISHLPNLLGTGLMTVAPYVADTEQVRSVFAQLRILRDIIQAEIDPSWSELSMGMSGDFQVAIEEGATIVRIGRALFGERQPTQV